MAAITAAIASGIGIASSLGGAAMSFTQANKQQKLQEEAEAEATKAMLEARGRLDINYMNALSVQKEPYERQREAMVAQGAQAIDAAQESERGTAAAAGRVQMAQDEAQAGIRTDMTKELTEIERLKVAEDARLRDLNVQLDLAEGEGKQMEARNAAEMAGQAKSQGFQGVTSAATQVANLIPLYGYKKDAAVPGYSGPKASATNNTTLVNPNGTTSQIQTQNLQWNPIGAGMPTLNPNQQYQGILGNQISYPVTSYPDFQINPFPI
jgi:hypothetical protein